MRRAAVLAVLVCAACSSSGSRAPKPSAPETTTQSNGFCKPGQRPTAGEHECVSVGPRATPGGFEPDPSGWGFRAVVPVSPCTGATMAVLGSTQCEPIDDCSAAFPPKDVTAIVRKNGTPLPERPNVPTFATLVEAVATVSSGNVIAIDEGDFDVAPIDASVKLVGRCAERTRLVAEDFGFRFDAHTVSFQSLSFVGASKAALLVNRDATVNLDRVYFIGTTQGASVANGATLNAKRTVFEGPSKASGIGASTGISAYYGGRAAVEDSEFRGYQISLDTGSVDTSVTVRHSIIHEERALDAGPEAIGHLGAFLGARVRIEESFIGTQLGRMVVVGSARFDGKEDPTSPGNPPASVTIARSALLHDVVPRESGSALDVLDGASLELEDVTLGHLGFSGIGASENATLTMRYSVVRAGPSPNNARSAVTAIKRATATIEDSAFVDSTNGGFVLDHANGTFARSVIDGNHATDCPDATAFLMCAQAVALSPGARASLVDSAIVRGGGTSIFLDGASLEVTNTLVAGTRSAAPGTFGAAVVGMDGAIAITASDFLDNDIGIALAGGKGLVRDSRLTGHREAVRVQNVSFLQTSEAVDAALDGKLVASRSVFSANRVLVSDKALTVE
jgi:hypothetical protein